MKHCIKCGHEVVQGAKFCGVCGASLTEEKQPPIIVAAPPKKSRRSLYIVIASVGCLALLTFAGYRFFYPSREQELGGTHNNIGKTSAATSETDKKSIKVEDKKQNKRKEKIPSEFTGVFSFKNGEHIGLMDNKFNIINENIGKASVNFNQLGVGIVFKDEKWGLINTKGKTVLEPTYESMGRFNIPHLNTYTFSDLQSKNGIMDFQVKNENKSRDEDPSTLSGLINSQGKVVLEAGDYFFTPFMGKTMTTFIKNGSTGIVSEDGKIIVEAIYENCVILNDKLIGVKKKGDNAKFQILDLKGEVIKDTSYDMISALPNFPDHYSVTNSLGKSGIINSKFKEVVPIEISSYISVSEDHEFLLIQNNEKYGLQSLAGESVIEANYNYLSLPNENNIMAFSKGENHGLIDTKGNIVKEGFESNLYPVYGTNLFLQSSTSSENMSTTIYDSHGEMIIERDVFMPGSTSFPKNTYFLPETKEYSENMKLTVLNKDGKTLSTKATFLNDLDPYLFIQEDSHIKIVNKNTGKVVKEGNL